MLITISNIKHVNAQTIIVPDNYPTIQEAVNHSNDGDRIEVRAGTYNEHIVVDESVKIIGDGSSVTFVDGGGESNHIFKIEADDVEISGFTIQNCPKSRSGIRLERANSSYIHDNIFNECGGGVEIYWTKDHTIQGNTVTAATFGVFVKK